MVSILSWIEFLTSVLTMAISTKRKTQHASSSIKITDADIQTAKKEGPKALEYYKDFGLAETKSRAMNLMLSSATPLLGLYFLQWTPISMLVFIVVDAVITVLSDIMKYIIAQPWIDASHQRDHHAGRILLIFDGLEDGTGQRADTGKEAPLPGVILFFGVVSTLFLAPIIAVVGEQVGIGALEEVINDKYFTWVVGIDFILRVGGSLYHSIIIRQTEKGEQMLFMESGSVAVLYAGLLMLIWLPAEYGNPGLIGLFVILYTFRIAFGIFAYLWTPRAIRVIERRLRENDFLVKPKKKRASA